MKPLFRSFRLFMRQIREDNMLLAVLAAPVLASCFFRFGVPYLEGLLCGYFGKQAILADYYLLFDLFLSILTPYMFCFASAMVMLTEYDENMSGYIAVTPIGKSGYLISRLIFPAGLSYLASVLLMGWFSLTEWTAPMLLLTCLLTSVSGMAVSLLLFSFSRNRVEGMAVGKLSGLFMLGLPVPFFLSSGAQYLFGVLPSFWIARFCLDRNFLLLFPAFLTSAVWIWLMYRKFERKLT